VGDLWKVDVFPLGILFSFINKTGLNNITENNWSKTKNKNNSTGNNITARS